MSERAVFLDRDGVIIRDANLLTRSEEVELYPCVPKAIALLKQAGFKVIVVTNQTVIARGLATEEEVGHVHDWIQNQLIGQSGLGVDRFYVCPHHPKANRPQYRQICTCRKPAPGMLKQAALDFGLELKNSFMVGDRLSDVLAGYQAGTTTILVETGMHDAPLIESMPAADSVPEPDYRCPDLGEAVNRILQGTIIPRGTRAQGLDGRVQYGEAG